MTIRRIVRRMIRGTAKPRYISVNRGLALLDEAIEQIELQEKRENGGDWQQQDWRCGSGMCLAGWIDQLAGGQWAFPVGNEHEDYLVATDDDYSEAVETIEGKRVVHAQNRAEELLGVDGGVTSHGWLFGPSNSLHDIRRIRNWLAADGLIGD